MRRTAPYAPQDHELRTVVDIKDTHSLFLECQSCKRLLKLDPVAQIQKQGTNCPLHYIRMRSKCGECSSTDVQLLLHQSSMRGDRTWTPRPPQRHGR